MDNKNTAIKECSLCGYQPDSNGLLIDNLYPINRERTRWILSCSLDNGGCGRVVYGNSENDVIEKWNENKTDDYLY